MKLEEQVVSRKLAKILEKLGVKQESLFWWIHSSWHPAEGEPWELGYKDDFPGAGTQKEDYSAFTVAELGEMLPPEYVSFKGHLTRGWFCAPEASDCAFIKGDTEADARAKMLIYLIENKLIKAGEIK